jgi:HEAT repeat protein
MPVEVWVFGQSESGAHRVIALEEEEPALDEAAIALQQIINEFERNPQAAKDAARRHSDPTVREAAIRYLGQRKTDDGIAVLLEILRETDPHMRQTAFEALGASVENDPRVRKFMNELVQTAKDPAVKEFAADALGGTAPTDNVDF